jgi:predicted RNA-binding Zn ribbon-like protein
MTKIPRERGRPLPRPSAPVTDVDFTWPSQAVNNAALARARPRSSTTRTARCTPRDNMRSTLFLDRSRRHNRRWCDMLVCGSRAKARAYYARRRG